MFAKANISIKKLAIVVLRLRSGHGECDLGTGVLIHNCLVLTSYMNLPSKESAQDKEIVLTDGYIKPGNNNSPSHGEYPSRVLTRKLLPMRLRPN